MKLFQSIDHSGEEADVDGQWSPSGLPDDIGRPVEEIEMCFFFTASGMTVQAAHSNLMLELDE